MASVSLGAEESLADVLESHPRGWERSGERTEMVRELRNRENRRGVEARRWAAERGLPTRVERPDGRVEELVDLVDGRPVYYGSHNINAAITIAADRLWAAPFALDAAGFTVGMWDSGVPRVTHREFQGRINLLETAPVINHATHVAGTLAAAGIQPSVRGIAPAVLIDAYDWNNDKSEMAARAATWPGEPGAIPVSNHSYGVLAGWNSTGKSSPRWEWRGSVDASVEDTFGRYNTYSRDSDALAANAPYFLMVRSAGNDRDDNPEPGDPITMTTGGVTVVPYDPAIHPPGDGLYRDGYDTLSFDALAKNVLTVGAVNDGVLFNAGPVNRPTPP